MENPETLNFCYRVLAPFTFVNAAGARAHVKPMKRENLGAVYIELAADEAAPLIAAGLVSGEDVAQVPSPEDDDPNTSQSEAASAEAIGAGQQDQDQATGTAATDAGGGQQDQAAAGDAKADAKPASNKRNRR